MPTLSLIAATCRTASVSYDAENNLFALAQAAAWDLLGIGGDVVASGNTRQVTWTLCGLRPDTTYRLLVEHETLEFTTKSETTLLDIRDFGATPDATDNSAAIQSAIEAAPAGATLRLPAGTWFSGPIFLKNHLTFLLDEGAVLADIGTRDNRPILDARHEDGRVLGTWEGVAEPCFASLVNAIDCEDVTLTGTGVVDGGGDRGDWWSWPKETRQGARRPRTLFFSGCRDLTLTGVTVRNSPSWTVHPVLCSRVLAADLQILNHPDSPNTDGFNPEASSDIHLVGLDISVGDDCIAIKAGKRDPRGGPDRPTEKVQISNCRMQRGHGAVVMGSEMSRGISDVIVRNSHFIGTDRGLRIKTRRGRGGFVKRIRLEACQMDDVATPIAVNAFYFCDSDGRSDYVQSRSVLAISAETPSISDISIRNLSITGAKTAAAVFFGLPEAMIEEVEIDGLTIRYDPDAEPDIPEMACHLPTLRHAGIIAENTRFRTLRRLTPASIHPDF
ncbi:glycoside hydrolase family 28 protein [Peteryoungia desertarenae]|uniref:Glycoside hydrolase family 28 protein n=1 Tax=Peteryoungia desertarenae TaxID=1813451 RepID=A0ABX6QIM9_9HYPH|nr:glycoside hydrolase family 28 protein [Peteryoungia desertarenae]QLF68421.1 glycoside hydrolase family 28 protein [Peteryoungia desertarenae]